MEQRGSREETRSGRSRRGLLARVIERRRREKGPDGGRAGPQDSTDTAPRDERIAALESRLDHLESLVEGLQDAVHRDVMRHDRELRELEQKTEASEIARSLAEHDRRHGF